MYTLLFARLVTSSGRVYAFEPMRALYKELQRNVLLNRFEQVQCVQRAISDQTGPVQFVAGPSHSMGHLVAVGRHNAANMPLTESFQVESTTLDDFVNQGGLPPTFLKVDVEGAEARVLHGGKAVLEEHRPTLILELHNPGQDVAVGMILKELGYRARRVDKKAPPVLTLSSGWPDPNGLWGHIMAIPAERATGSDLQSC
jgi:FkbM family methyltransferase